MVTTYLLIIGAGLLASLQLILLSLKERQFHYIWLSLFVMAMLVPVWNMTYYWATLDGLSFIRLSGLFSLLPWLYGPFIWWHVSENIEPTRNWRRSALHVTPFLVQFILMLSNNTSLSLLTSGSFHFFLLIGHISIYTGYSCFYLLSQRSKFLARQAKQRPSTHIGYSVLMIGLFFILLWDFWISGRAVFNQPNSLTQWNTLFLVEGSYVAVLALIAPILQWQFIIPSNKEDKTRLSATAAASLANELKSFMETESAFTDPDLNLSKLADKLGISSHDLSEVLNRQIQLSFYEFVNQYRIEMACEKLKEPSKQSATEIGFDSGFNSKSAFYNAFKKHLNTTPAKYRQAPSAESVENGH